MPNTIDGKIDSVSTNGLLDPDRKYVLHRPTGKLYEIENLTEPIADLRQIGIVNMQRLLKDYDIEVRAKLPPVENLPLGKSDQHLARLQNYAGRPDRPLMI